MSANVFLPESLRPHFDDAAWAVHEHWQHISLDNVVSTMPELQSYDAPNGEGIMYADLVPDRDFDEENVIPLRLPIANGLRPHMLIRAKVLQDLLPVPQRVRIFPNDTKKQPTTNLNQISLSKINEGDLTPLAELQQASIEHSYGDVGIDPSGYSVGGSVAIYHALVGPARSLDFAEIPNIARRTDKELDNDAMNGEMSLRPYNKAVLDSDIPALTVAFGTRGERATLRQLAIGGVLFLRDTKLPINKAIKNGLGYNRATRKLVDAAVKDSGIAVVSGRSLKGKLMPNNESEYLEGVIKNYFVNSEIYHIDEYAHEAGDNVWVPALLSRRARQLAIAADVA